MPSLGSYPELDIWDKLIDVLKTDSYISSLITFINPTTRQNESKIYNLALDSVTIKKYPAVSVVFNAASELNVINGLETVQAFNSNYYVYIAYQHSDLAIAIRNCWKLAKDIEYTLRKNANLSGLCGGVNVKRIFPTDSATFENNLWTVMLTIDLDAINTSNFVY